MQVTLARISFRDYDGCDGLGSVTRGIKSPGRASITNHPEPWATEGVMAGRLSKAITLILEINPSRENELLKPLAASSSRLREACRCHRIIYLINY